MTRFRIEYHGGQWCIIERTLTGDAIINQFDHKDNATIHLWGLQYTTGS